MATPALRSEDVTRRPRAPRSRAALLSAMLVVAPFCSSAATFCVTNATEFRAALDTAESNGQDDQIRLNGGVYETADGNTAFLYSTTENFALSISGGWITFSGTPCGFVLPSGSTISGSGVRRALRLYNSSGSGNLAVVNLQIRDGLSALDGGGLSIGGALGYTGNILVEGVRFVANRSTSDGGAIQVTAGGGKVVIRNNLFANNSAAESGAAELLINAPDTTTPRLELNHNTFDSNTCVGASCVIDDVHLDGSAASLVYNNLFTAGTALDLMNDSAALVLSHNQIVDIAGGAPVIDDGNVAFVDPGLLLPGSGNPNLTEDSPMRDRGTNAYPLPSTDINAVSRPFGPAVDIGAYELNTLFFRDSFESP